MQAESHPPSNALAPIDVFKYIVRSRSVTLISISEETRCCVEDLLDLNPQLADSNPTSPLALGTVISLPPCPRYKGYWPLGSFFSLETAEHRLQKLDTEMEKLVRSTEPLPLPRRKVKSRTELIVESAYSEAARQLDIVEKFMTSADAKKVKKQIHHVVDVSIQKRNEEAIEQQFLSSSSTLGAFRAENAHCFLGSDNTPSFTTVGLANEKADNDAASFCTHDCLSHTHQWEFVFCKSNSYEEQEVWAVVSCQELSVLSDLISCPVRERLDGFNSSFFYIGGRFFTVGDVDLSSCLRTPIEGEVNSSFSSSTCTPASSVTFGELRVRCGEMYVFRHMGDCDHYFYLRGVSKFNSSSSYPCCLAKRKGNVIRCFSCEKFASTVALYKRSEPSSKPQYYCDVCYELLFNPSDPQFLKVVPPTRGDYFTS